MKGVVRDNEHNVRLLRTRDRGIAAVMEQRTARREPFLVLAVI